MTASTVTTSRFGPSGSWKRKNNVLEHTSAVIPRSSNDLFFAVKGMVVEQRLLYHDKFSVSINFKGSRVTLRTASRVCSEPLGLIVVFRRIDIHRRGWTILK